MLEKPIVKQLEKKLAQLMPLKHFLVTAFSRNAFFLLIKAFGWESPDEIIIPAFTCPVIRHTAEAAGMNPVPIDAEPDGLNIDPNLLQERITAHTRAIYVVHTYGIPAQMEKICEIAREHDLVVIEDLAHALFTVYNGQTLGSYGDFAILSFTKQIVDFEGGAIATNHTAIYQKMLKLREEYQQPGKVSINSLIDSYVRMTGSWWESSFSLPSLGLMKLHDYLNNLIYKGLYGIKVDYTRFYASSMGCRLALLQLDRLYARKRKLDYKNEIAPFKAAASGKVVSPYNTGVMSGKDFTDRILSFRTWHNPNKKGLYPRADYLYQQLRIFSRVRCYFRIHTSAISGNSIQPLR